MSRLGAASTFQAEVDTGSYQHWQQLAVSYCCISHQKRPSDVSGLMTQASVAGLVLVLVSRRGLWALQKRSAQPDNHNKTESTMMLWESDIYPP